MWPLRIEGVETSHGLPARPWLEQVSLHCGRPTRAQGPFSPTTSDDLTCAPLPQWHDTEITRGISAARPRLLGQAPDDPNNRLQAGVRRRCGAVLGRRYLPRIWDSRPRASVVRERSISGGSFSVDGIVFSGRSVRQVVDRNRPRCHVGLEVGRETWGRALGARRVASCDNVWVRRRRR
jgi:hypothetical protein